MQVHHAVAAGLPVAVDVAAGAAEHEITRIADGECRACACPAPAPASAMNGLNVEPGGYTPCSARLLSGWSGELFSASQFCGSMPSTNRLGSKPGLRHQRQHAAGGGFDRHQRSAAVAEHLLGDFLQPGIERQQQIVARHRQGAAQRAHRAAVGVGLDFFVAGDAAQIASRSAAPGRPCRCSPSAL